VINLQRLRLLYELSVLGTISSVAHAMHLTRPAVSQQLALLEKEVGEPLLERSVRGTRLTATGQALANRASEVFTLVDRLDEDLQSQRDLIAGEVRISAFGSLATGLAPAAFKQIQSNHPMVRLSFTEIESNGGLKAVVAREVDLAVIDEWADIARPARPLEFAPLGEDRFILVVGKHHPLADRKQVRLHELSEDAWAINQAAPAYRAKLMRACQEAGFTPREVCSCHNITATVEFVRETGLVAILPTLGLGPFRNNDQIRLISLNPPIRRKIRVAMLPQALHRPAVNAAYQALREVAGRVPTTVVQAEDERH